MSDVVGNQEEIARLVTDGARRENEESETVEKSSKRSSTEEMNFTPHRSLDSYLENAYQKHSAESFGWCHHQWKYWSIMLSLGVANSSDASEILCISYILSDSIFSDRILLNSNWRAGMLAATVFAGMLMGGLVVGTLGDWKGRKRCLLFGLLLNMTAGLLSACAPNAFILAILRMAAGVGIGASVPPLFTLVAELAPPSKRGFCVTLCASFWMVGSIFVALVAILFLGNNKDGEEYNVSGTHLSSPFLASLTPARWRLFAFVCALPSATGAALVNWLVPESPRFLALEGKFDEAALSATLLGMSLQRDASHLRRCEVEEHFGNASRSYASSHPAQTLEGELSLAVIIQWIRLGLVDFEISASKLYTSDLWATTWPLQMAWFSLSFGSYGLMTWINTLFFAVHLENVYFNALLFATANLPGNIISALFLDRLGRSKLLVGSILSASMSLLAFAAFASTSNETSNSAPPNTFGIVLSACSFQCFTIAAWNTIDVMTSELFPTTVRSTGMGVCTASGRIGALIAQPINSILVGRPVRLLVVASVTLMMGAMTPFLLPRHSDMTGAALAEEYGRLQIAESANEGEGEELEDFRSIMSAGNANSVAQVKMHSETVGLARRGLSPVSRNEESFQRKPAL